MTKITQTMREALAMLDGTRPGYGLEPWQVHPFTQATLDALCRRGLLVCDDRGKGADARYSVPAKHPGASCDAAIDDAPQAAE